MNILDRLNSGELHALARTSRPDCVDAKGNIHHSAARAQFVDWMDCIKADHGQDHRSWPVTIRQEYRNRYVPSH